MNGKGGYAVFFFPQALEALGDAVKPYLQDSPAVGTHIACDEIDTAGGFVEMTMRGKTSEGRDAALELIVPSSMIRMIVSSQQDGAFGFRPHLAEAPAVAAGVPGAGPAGDVAQDAGAATEAPAPSSGP